MQCPKCKFEQAGNIVCERCGLIFEKYFQYHDRASNEPKPVPSYAAPSERHSITQIPLIKSLNTLVFYGSLLLLIIGYFKRDEFLFDFQYDDALLEEPVQMPSHTAPFNLSKNDIDYQIQPLYQYQLSGLVVSYRHHDGEYSLHKRWNDHLNIADICVVWGDNTDGLNLNAFSFWSGIFTCNLETKNQQAWEQFNPNQLSNNHLLTEDNSLRDIIADVQIGDQIQIRGVLAQYSNNLGFNRGTSTTRTDKGDGACETIYVEDFEIIRPSANQWRKVFDISLFSLIISFGWWIYSVIRE